MSLTPPPAPVVLPPPPDDLTPEGRFDVATMALAHFQQASQQADGKANMLVAVLAGVFALMINRLDEVGVATSGWQRGAGWAATAVLVASGAGCAACLAWAIVPRTTEGSPANRFSFPSVARYGVPAPGGTRDELAAEMWAVAEVVARIALTKNRHVYRALWLLGVTIGAAAALFLLSA